MKAEVYFVAANLILDKHLLKKDIFLTTDNLVRFIC